MLVRAIWDDSMPMITLRILETMMAVNVVSTSPGREQQEWPR